MKTDPLKSNLAELAEEAVPSDKINLWPGIKSEISTSAWHSKNGETMNTLAQKTLIRRLSLAALALATAFTLLAFPPKDAPWRKPSCSSLPAPARIATRCKPGK